MMRALHFYPDATDFAWRSIPVAVLSDRSLDETKDGGLAATRVRKVLDKGGRSRRDVVAAVWYHRQRITGS